MNILITTQAVDLDDPILGFFHRWIEEFARQCEQVTVICLKEGRHSLPPNVQVLSLGKEVRRSRLGYVWRFFHYMYAYRKQYDAVFVHMNPEYVCLGGIFWRQWGKCVVLWRNHKQGGFLARLGAHLSDVVCYTSPAAYVARFRHAVRMPIGIDTETFTPAATPPNARTILFLGRLDPVKQVDVFVTALQQLELKGVLFNATIVGEPTDSSSVYFHNWRAKAKPLIDAGVLAMRPSVRNSETPELYRAHAIYCNLTPSGSFDKTLGEAASCGAILVASNDAVRDIVPDERFVKEGSADAVAAALRSALELTDGERLEQSSKGRAWVAQHHSLKSLIPGVLELLEAAR